MGFWLQKASAWTQISLFLQFHHARLIKLTSQIDKYLPPFKLAKPLHCQTIAPPNLPNRQPTF
ncbi:hypothetical protein B0181_00800 [Moraxella caviae]|uniref:Uncharacterized protein n=1 Tax=Moraxella caviae TaxID=34060 RepID=A0A1T0ABZ6_9GAMM|nr:hypothetical protein B0181_00800 [Moraxella caviae]